MGKHVCIKEVPNRKFTIGKIYDDTQTIPEYQASDKGCWIRSEDRTLTFFSKLPRSIYSYEYRSYYDYFENVVSVIRDNKIKSIIIFGEGSVG